VYAWEMTLTGIDRALMALDVLDEPQATPLDPEAEQRLHALLAERVAPLLLRCLQTWEGGAGAFGRLWGVAQRACSAAALLRCSSGGRRARVLGLWLVLMHAALAWSPQVGWAGAVRVARARAVPVRASPAAAMHRC